MAQLGFQIMSSEEFARVLADIASHARDVDTTEGQLEWHAVAPYDGAGLLAVRGVYRIGARSGKGAVVLIGDAPGLDDLPSVERDEQP